jgi:heme/copper-type cytochrome/quinol oxidase subunit 2
MRSEATKRGGALSGGTPDLAWSVPVMRVGYAGRGLVYLAVALFSLYAIWQGGRAQGTSPVLKHLENSVAGDIVLALIGVGLLAFAVWCAVEAIYDLDARGSDIKGIAARGTLIVSSLVALGIGGAALLLLLAAIGGSGSTAEAAAAASGAGSATGGSQIDRAVATVMDWPGGRWIVGIVGLGIIGSGVFQFVAAGKETYRRYLVANRFTRRWDWVLKTGVMARGLIIAVVGVLFVLAAWRANPYEAGGVDKAFAWITGQPYGWVVVAAICVGLLGYALFCFVNAAYRFVPRVAGGDIETLAAWAKAKLRLAT